MGFLKCLFYEKKMGRDGVKYLGIYSNSHQRTPVLRQILIYIFVNRHVISWTKISGAVFFLCGFVTYPMSYFLSQNEIMILVFRELTFFWDEFSGLMILKIISLYIARWRNLCGAHTSIIICIPSVLSFFVRNIYE